MKEHDFYLIEKPDIDSSTLSYKERFKGEVGDWFLKVQGHAILNFLKTNNCKNILYVGGGHAQNINELLNNNINITVQGSDQSCKILLQDYIDSKKISFIISDLSKLPFPNNYFDAVIAIRMLTHLTSWKTFIKEIGRVSKNVIIVDYPSIRSINIFSEILFSFKKAIEKTTRKYKLFSNKEIESEFKKNNYLALEKTPQFFLPMVFHRMLKNVKISKIIEKIMETLFFTNYFGSPIIACFKKEECEKNNN